ncbi:DUF362 domain-containing protein [Methanolobus chelungpuianus]|uniref:(Fe-S)-binding protein n=1 Tax=Methanolobus chelungpuianus TaxID=502115 RepID=A0AAE3KX08_9EURY|nr:DUF362 domain-containing protein [Methanolobus chelungpuianus]MCQ6962601.1 (Fe-S)-binding protein [Methanolobus chelungpuianus]
MASKVSIIPCTDYSLAAGSVRASVDLIGGLLPVIQTGDRVLLKPNILAARRPENAVTTHPAIVSAMCELVREAGGIPVIGDGAGIACPGATAEAFAASGIAAVAEELDVELINFQTAGFEKVDVPLAMHFPKLFVSKAVLDADVIISLPKLKTHELTYYTGAVKNMFGALPLKHRKEMHLLAERKLFGEAVIDLYSVARPHLAVMDGVVGMEGNGPSHGKPVNTGVIMAGYDPVSLDITASRLIGLDPMEVPTTRAALERGFGTCEPEIVGAPLEGASVKYKPSNGGILFNVPTFITRIFGRYYSVMPGIDNSRCIRCGACVSACPVHAIGYEDDKLSIDKERCILCYCCREMCPEDAVGSERSLLAKILANA